MKKVQPLAYGQIAWVGINPKKGQFHGHFSQECDGIIINSVGINSDQYSLHNRALGVHDDYYCAVTGLARGTMIKNHRTITILDQGEVKAATAELGYSVTPGQLRENMILDTHYHFHGLSFSQLPIGSLLVIAGENGTKVLRLNEQNRPCRTVGRPWAADQVHGAEKRAQLADQFVAAFRERRGMLVDVMSEPKVVVKAGNRFVIYPPNR